MEHFLGVILFGLGLIVSLLAFGAAVAGWVERPKVGGQFQDAQDKKLLEKMVWRGVLSVGFAVMLARAVIRSHY